MKKFFISRLIRLWNNKDGQVMAFVLAILFVLVLFFVTVPLVTKVTSDKLRTQTAADAGAFSAATWMARGLNTINFVNNSIEAMYLDIAIVSVLWLVSGTLALVPYTNRVGGPLCENLFGADPTTDPLRFSESFSDKINNLYESIAMFNSLYNHIQSQTILIAKEQGEKIAGDNVSIWSEDIDVGVMIKTDNIPLRIDYGATSAIAEVSSWANTLARLLRYIANIGDDIVIDPLNGISANIQVFNWVEISQKWGWYDDEGFYHSQWFRQSFEFNEESGWENYYNNPESYPVQSSPPIPENAIFIMVAEPRFYADAHAGQLSPPPISNNRYLPRVVDNTFNPYIICYVSRPPTLPIVGRIGVFQNISSPKSAFAVSQAKVYKENLSLGNITLLSLPGRLSGYNLDWTAKIVPLTEDNGINYIVNMLRNNNVGQDFHFLEEMDALLLH